MSAVEIDLILPKVLVETTVTFPQKSERDVGSPPFDVSCPAKVAEVEEGFLGVELVIKGGVSFTIT